MTAPAIDTMANQPRRRDLTLIDIKEVSKMTSFSRAYIYKMLKDGCFPAQYSFGTRTVRWLKSDVEAWIEGKLSGAIS